MKYFNNSKYTNIKNFSIRNNYLEYYNKDLILDNRHLKHFNINNVRKS